MISLNRSIPDVRMDECKYWHYPEDLPTVSIVIAFHNEGWTPLLRTVHSVLLRSPLELIKEIILVDDFSDKDHLKDRLDIYLKQFNGKVKLIRNTEREGLIRTRSIGAKEAVGDVVIFLDAHCEVNINWLPPLLAPIRQNRKVMTVPVIDGIDKDDWSYRIVYNSVDRHYRGIFEWGLLYKETEISAQELIRRKHNSEPFRSPTHAGGLFAINKKWFKELGYYDPGLQIWGGEQYELSFKIWQCGGGILFVPCSHVGHVYRSHMPYGFGKLSGKPVISTNMLRVIKTWMDEYDKYYYIREPSAKHRLPGNISSQLELRKNLKCKSFKWYMEKVAYDVIVSYPLPPENQVWGEARNLATGKCIDTMGRPVPGIVGATSCHGYGGNQLIKLNKEGQLTQGEWCITPMDRNLITKHCVKGTVDGPFTYSEKSEQIMINDLCLTAAKSVSSSILSMEKCTQFKERNTAKGLIAVVTGCNCGIGKEIVRELNLRGAKVYMLCRSEDRARDAVIELVKLGCNSERLLVKVVDLARFKSIRTAAAEIIEEEDHLDILINNAGIMLYPKFKLTDDGHELVWQTNYLGHFLLTELLLPLLRAAPTARIVNISALAHFYADPIDLKLIDRREGWDSRQSYSKSKLAMVMHAFELTKRLRAYEKSHITINVCHPGLCNTRLMRYTPLAQKPLNCLTAPFRWYLLKTPKDGAQTPLFWLYRKLWLAPQDFTTGFDVKINEKLLS
ncbi:N-acetylgalactosaminyltransferase 7 [Dirofilaria immitis]|nr:N-acetylgalactosaminyltransferase 7 [Dirofilaria immitis]